jgi:hypothetical protein
MKLKYNDCGNGILDLVVSKKPYEVMVTGEKTFEYRRASRWILSRLIDKNGDNKKYDKILFRNGYHKNSNYFICKYKGFSMIKEFYNSVESITYSNGLIVDILDYDIMISLGKIIEIGKYGERPF